MAESLAALGVAANIAQFTELGIKTTSLIIKVFKSPDGLIDENREFAIVAQDLREQLPTILGDVARPSDPQLKKLFNECAKLATALEGEIERITVPQDGARSLTRLLLSARAIARKPKIEDLHQRMLLMRGQISFRLDSLLRTRERELVLKLDNAFVESRTWNVELVQKIDGISTDLHRLLSSDAAEGSTDSTREGDFRTLVELFTSYVAESKKHDRLQALLQPLYFPQINERQNNVPAAHSETFSWAWDHDASALPMWLSEGSGLFWITGKPGSGKSTLMKYLHGHHRTQELLERWAAEKPILTPSFFFWSPGTHIQRSLTGFLCSIIFKILVKIPELADVICPERWNDPNPQLIEPWSIDELTRGIRRLAVKSELPVRICVFVDGLDEADDGPNEILSVLRLLRGSANIKVCVSSRPWVVLANAFRDSPQLRMQDLTHGDIASFARATLRASSRFQNLLRDQPEQAHGLISDVIQRAEGVFLWVSLTVKSLLDGLDNYDTIEDLRQRLLILPSDLQELFLVMLNRIQPQYWQDCAILFKCLQVLRRPLPVVAFWAMTKEKSGFSRKWAFAPAKGEEVKPEANDLAITARRAFTEESEITLKGLQLEARCKDIIRLTYQEYRPAPGNTMVEFVHRTVADFFSTGEVSHLVDGYLPENFDVFLTLAGSMNEVIRQRLLSEPRLYDQQFCEWILVAIYFIQGLEGPARGAQLSLLDDLNRSLDGMDWTLVFSSLRPRHRADLRGESFATLVPRLGFPWHSLLMPQASDSRAHDARIARCLLSALKPRIELWLDSNILYEQSRNIDLDMIHRTLAYEEAGVALKLPHHYGLWPTFLIYLLDESEPDPLGGGLPVNTLDALKVMVAYGAPRMLYLPQGRARSLLNPKRQYQEIEQSPAENASEEDKTQLVDCKVIFKRLGFSREHQNELLSLFPKPEHRHQQVRMYLEALGEIRPRHLLSALGVLFAIVILHWVSL